MSKNNLMMDLKLLGKQQEKNPKVVGGRKINNFKQTLIN
jgi:hypothetical protein